LLTDKWLPCVPYLQIYCVSFAFYPVHSCNLQAINAVGRSDMFLKLEIIKKSYGIVALIIAVVFFKSPIAIAMTGIITTVLSCLVNAFPNKKLINYSYFEQMKDILPSFAVSLAMFGAVWAIGMIPIAPILVLIVQIVVGVIVYALLSAVFRLRGFIMLMNVIKKFIKKGKNNDSDKGTGIEISSKS
ncbi:MAG: polysaccharide biosynthesis C-terminal domain-containing protein, partial [Clostridia bacterium]|nr:polysaccharide biosynthesis C-terminal domain-containing protein [Clostridia bacterium]